MAPSWGYTEWFFCKEECGDKPPPPPSPPSPPPPPLTSPIACAKTYALVREKVNFNDALTQCPLRGPGWELATAKTDAEFRELARTMVAEFPNPPDKYQGAWVGLTSPDAAPTPSGVPAQNWQWTDGTNRNGPTADPAFLSNYWGPVGTGYSGDTGECVPENGCSPANGFLRAQPDNAGGKQRCALIAVGQVPPTPTSPFYDDQNCDGGIISGVNNNRAKPPS